MNKYRIETFGCKLNERDSREYEEVLSRFLNPSEEKEGADLILINSCGVVERAERNIIKRAREHKERGRTVVITGCLPSITNEDLKNTADEVVRIGDLSELSRALSRLTKREPQEKSDIKKETSLVSGFIAISKGCLGNCSYCATKLSRGKLKSKEQKKILHEVEELLSRGCKEIHLTSQDLAIYGLDRGKQELPQLLQEILNREDDFRLKLGMTNPFHTKRILGELLDIFKDERVYKYLHVPVQSGSNEMLKKMRRGHAAEDFQEIVQKVYGSFSDFLMATDIIVGFPGEGEEEFQKTYELIEKVRPHIVNITRFSPRPGTEATKMNDKCPEDTKKERSRTLNHLTKRIRLEQNAKLQGGRFKILVSEKGKKGTQIARLPSYRALIVKRGFPGEIRQATVTGYEYNYLKGELL